MNEYLNSANANNFLWLTLLIAARLFGAMYICPLFSEKYLPKMLKMILALFIAFIIFPYFAKEVILVHDTVTRIILLIKEFIFGVILSYLFSLPIWLVENVGNLIDTQRGEQLGAIINQATDNPSSSISALLLQGFIAYIVALNGILFLLQIIMQSFLILPINRFLPLNPYYSFNVYIDYFGKYSYWVIIIALPILFILFLIDLTMGLIGSFVPSMNITILAMPIKSIIAIFFLIFYIGIIYYVDFVKFMEPIKKIVLNG
jgi:type III secretion protein T